MQSNKKKKFMLLGLALLFLAPVVLSTLAYYFDWFRLVDRSNRGTLLSPPIVLGEQYPLLRTAKKKSETSEPAPHKWSLVFNNDAAVCRAVCMEQLDLLYKVFGALGKDMERVQIVLMLSAPEEDEMQRLRTQFPHLVLIKMQTGFDKRFQDEKRLGGNTIYIGDPQGNFVTAYAVDSSPYDIRKDMKRLLWAFAR